MPIQVSRLRKMARTRNPGSSLFVLTLMSTWFRQADPNSRSPFSFVPSDISSMLSRLNTSRASGILSETRSVAFVERKEACGEGM